MFDTTEFDAEINDLLADDDGPDPDRIHRCRAVEIAGRVIEAAGFVMSGASNVSEARYYRLPGRSGNLRVAAHECRHPYDVVFSLEFVYRDAWMRDADDTGLCEDEVIDLAREAIAEYLDSAETDEEDE